MSTIDDYLNSLPEHIRAPLENLRQLIRRTLPEAEEVISYQMPAFKRHGVVIWFAANKNHYGLYVKPHILQVFSERFGRYTQTKSAIHLPLDQPFPEVLIAEMVAYSARENEAEAALKKKKKTAR